MEGRLRVVPEPDSAASSGPGSVESGASGSAWVREAEQDDWCVDAGATASAACRVSDAGSTSMPASERRAVHLTRQRIRAQAILATAEPGPEQARRDRVRRAAIVIGSGLLHVVGFVVLAKAVADVRPRPRPREHEHLFEARAVVPVELEQPAPIEPPERASEPPEQASEPTPSKPKPARKPAKPAAASESSQPSEPKAYQLRGFEFSSEGELAGGEPGGEPAGRPGGHGTGRGGGSGEGTGVGGGPKLAKPDVQASPRGGLVEPEYPPDLERRGVEGSVLVKVWIDEHGHVIKAEVADSSGHEALDHNALMAAQRQEWTAARRDGEAVASTRRYRIHFRLR